MLGRVAHLIVFATLAIGAAAPPPSLKTIDGRVLAPFTAGPGARIVFLITTDCSIANGYAPEIQRVCRGYAPRGVSCSLVYEDVGIDAGAVRTHYKEYRYDNMPAALDTDHRIARHVGASVTPAAVVVDRSGAIRYEGRIDNLYADIGKPRQHATAHDLTDALDAVLAGKPVAHPTTEAVGCYIVGEK
jgi:hypothetical protein